MHVSAPLSRSSAAVCVCVCVCVMCWYVCVRESVCTRGRESERGSGFRRYARSA